ncbi:MAG: cellulase family glycosylhydrolase [Frankiales bacterium]|nr:cellulase family glycosylhydrolase [Frankiales bacterium]
MNPSSSLSRRVTLGVAATAAVAVGAGIPASAATLNTFRTAHHSALTQTAAAAVNAPSGQSTVSVLLPASATSFAGATTGWSSLGAAVSWLAGVGHNAPGALAVTSAGVMTAANSPSFAVTPGARYSVGGWLRAALTGHSVTMGVRFYDATGKFVGGPSTETGQPVTDSATAWTAANPAVAIAPANAATASVAVASMDNALGLVDYVDDLTVTQTTGVAAPIVGPLTTSGTNILDAYGRRVQLHGIQLGGLRTQNWSTSSVTTSEVAAAQSWGANFDRLPVAENPMTPGDCSYDQSYVDNVDRIVRDVTSRGMVILLDLHTNAVTPCGDWGNEQALPDSQAITFWQTVASRYKNNPLVAFDLYNEPHSITDAQWRNGGTVASNGVTFTGIGMQRLYDTVRGTGANNLVFASGSGWATYYPSTAPLTGTRNLVYGIHAYTCPVATPENGGTCVGGPGGLLDPSGILSAFNTIGTTAPVVITEFGYPDRNVGGAYITAAANYAASHGWAGWNVFVFDNTTTSTFGLVKSIGNEWQPTPSGMAVILGMQND